MGKLWNKVRRVVTGIAEFFFNANFISVVLGLFVIFCGIMAFMASGRLLHSSDKVPPKASAPASPVTVNIDLTIPLVVIGVGAAAFLFMKFAFPPLRRMLAARRERKMAMQDNTAAWAALRERKERLILAWSKYETDLSLMIDFPVMTDYTDPVVHKVVAAMQNIRLAEITNSSMTPARGSEYETAVNEFELAFIAAEKHARRHGQNLLSAQEQRKLATARTALDMIMSDTASGFEIDAAYKTLKSALKGIIDVRPQTLAPIDQLVRRELIAS